MADIEYDDSKRNIEIISRAVVIVDDCILLAHFTEASNTFLPGGHVEYDEGAEAALIRELIEELGLTATIDKYLGAVEHAFEDEDVHHHEINHFFLVQIPGLDANVNPESMEAQLEFFWSPIRSLNKHNLQPYPIQRLIRELLEGNFGIWWGSTLE